MSEEEVILYGSDKAARYVTDIRGWVDRNGLFYGDNKNSEHMARFSGCTHWICDRDFHSWDDIEDYLMDCEPCTKEDLCLVICRPVYLRQIDEDYWANDLPEEGDLPESVWSQLNALNEAIEQAGHIGWEPGKFAVDL